LEACIDWTHHFPSCHDATLEVDLLGAFSSSEHLDNSIVSTHGQMSSVDTAVGLRDSTSDPIFAFDDNESPRNNTYRLLQPPSLLPPLDTLRPGDVNAELRSLLQQTEALVDIPNLIKTIFHEYTCKNLSIFEPSDGNYWSSNMWSMSTACPMLYHSLAAMACMHVSNLHSALRVQGLHHMQQSASDMDVCDTSEPLLLDRSIAASIALAFAEAWGCGPVSSICARIETAQNLLQVATTTSPVTRPTTQNMEMFRFLAKTCLYVDVMTRLTTKVPGGISADSKTPSELLQPGPIPAGESGMDALMGYAADLFPIIGRVADLVRDVRRRTAKLNSPSIISRATELKALLEQWSTPPSIATTDSLSANQSDALQTAEAYRWATLSFLQQAVPELPSLFSYSELAQKVMVYLATIPISSKTVIVHTFPLLMAGCEAIEDEDRAWVHDRWRHMGRRIITGITERCLELTAEVWQRRDEYALMHDICPTTGAQRNSTSQQLPNTNSRQPQADVVEAPLILSLRRDALPISAAFKGGVDFRTRSGCIDYSVKGKLHWLGVLEDRNWESKQYRSQSNHELLLTHLSHPYMKTPSR
jgi:hypothetical protein